MAGPRKVVHHNLSLQDARLFQFDDEAWARLWDRPRRNVFDDFLRSEIESACTWLVIRSAMVQRGAAAAAAIRRPTRKQLAPLERYAKSLREAADAWKALQAAGYHPPIGGEGIETRTSAAERLLDELRSQEPQSVQPAWPVFVRMIASALRTAGFRPIANKRGYDGKPGRPTWFQVFMRCLNDELPADVRQPVQSDPAFAAAVAEAMKGGDA